MEKLKTLKDIELRDEIHKTHDCKACEGFSNCTDELENNILNKIKQEAIKWIKSYNIDKDSWTGKDIPSPENNLICVWIKHFFNITEEDLK